MAVGMACHTNPFPLMIPCHRVIRSDGSMGGFAVDLEIKRRLLAFELDFVHFRVADPRKHEAIYAFFREKMHKVTVLLLEIPPENVQSRVEGSAGSSLGGRLG